MYTNGKNTLDTRLSDTFYSMEQYSYDGHFLNALKASGNKFTKLIASVRREEAINTSLT